MKLTKTQDLKEHFEAYCKWCWGHGYGNCDACRKIYNKLYIPLRKRELQLKLGLIDESDYCSNCGAKMESENMCGEIKIVEVEK